jgi:uncharacterized protein YndB with AHSA1/START domain
MAKWLVGCLAVAIVVGGTLVWFGVRKFREFTGAPPIVVVMIQAPSERVFATLADPDSMKVWRSVTDVRSSRSGRLRVGDTLHTRIPTVSMPQQDARMPVDSAYQPNTEIVTELVPNRLLVLSMVGDNSGAPMMVRRDSLVALGDSTEVVTSFALPGSASMRERIDSTSATERRLLEMSLQLVLTVARVQAKMEHRRLKARIEGTPMPPAVEMPLPPKPPLPPLPPRQRQ